MRHIPADDLENYAMETLPPLEVDHVDEHLLICSECQDWLRATDEYVAAMRRAGEMIIRDKRAG